MLAASTAPLARGDWNGVTKLTSSLTAATVQKQQLLVFTLHERPGRGARDRADRLRHRGHRRAGDQELQPGRGRGLCGHPRYGAAVRFLVVAVAAAALLAGCGGSSRSTAPQGPPLETECGDLPKGLDAKPIWLHTSDGVRIYARPPGKGRRRSCSLHESDSNLCGWLPTMQWLAGNGIRAIAIDMRGAGRSGPGRSLGLLPLPPRYRGGASTRPGPRARRTSS